jgi:hypothetical protein
MDHQGNEDSMLNNLIQKKSASKQYYSSQSEFFDIINSITSENKITYIKHLDNILIEKEYAKLSEGPWCSFLTFPLHLPDWYKKGFPNPLNEFLSEDWRKNTNKCIGLFAFTKMIKNDLSELSDKFITNILHPLPLSVAKWSPEKFTDPSPKRIVQFGQEYRCLNAIFMLQSDKFNKILIATCDQNELDSILMNEQSNLGFEYRKPMLKTAEIIFDRIDNIESWYENSIFFLHLYDYSSDWIVLKCIADNVPLLINRLPSMHEYLGVDYPLYYSSYEEAIEKASDRELIIQTHEYLKKRSQESFFSLTQFMNKYSDLLSNQNLQH